MISAILPIFQPSSFLTAVPCLFLKDGTQEKNLTIGLLPFRSPLRYLPKIKRMGLQCYLD
jgi:hypothetical protein